MTSTQEPNIMVPQFALCICSRKWKAKLIVPSLESELSFDSKDSKINFDQACSTTVKSLPGALRAFFNISSDVREELFADELLV